MTRAAIYLRQSLDKDGTELGIERQLSECQRVAKDRAYDVIEVIRDNNRSATTGERPGYAHLLDIIDRQLVDVILVLRLDRLLRRPIELEWLIDLSEKTGVSVITADGMIDLTNPAGRHMARIQATFARWEVEVKSERHQLANLQKAQAGKPHGSRRPYGYEDSQLFIRHEEAAVLREMARRYLRGHGFRDIAIWANEAGHRTTTGKLWYPITVRNMLQKPRYAGERLYKGVTYAGQWERVFDERTWSRLQLSMRLRREKFKDVPKARKYLLTGLVYCGKCEHPLNGQTKRDRPDRPLRRTYQCRVQGDAQRKRGCGGVTRNADALEHFVTECVLYRLDTPELAALLRADPVLDEKIDELVSQRTDAANRLAFIEDSWSRGKLTNERFEKLQWQLSEQIQQLSDDIDLINRKRIEVYVPAGQTLRKAWGESGDEWRRALLGRLIARIDVRPGISKPFYTYNGKVARFDPSLVEIRWIA